MSYRILSFTPKTSTMMLDVMLDKKWGGQISLRCTPGKEYDYDTLKALAVEMKPSLKGKDFHLIPTEQKVM